MAKTKRVLRPQSRSILRHLEHEVLAWGVMGRRRFTNWAGLAVKGVVWKTSQG